MSEVVVGLDVHLKNTQVTVMKNDVIGDVVKRERVTTSKAGLRKALESVPKGSKVALESVGFCWPWIDFLEELGFTVLLANPLKVKLRAEDIKNDKVDSKTLADLTRMNWLPTCYIPPAELRWLRSLQASETGPGLSSASEISLWMAILAQLRVEKQLWGLMFLRSLKTWSF
jgi:transposase